MPRNPPQPSPDVVYQYVEGEAILVHIPSNKVFTLNETGAALWRLIGQGCTRAEIGAALTRQFEISHGAVEREVDDMLERLEGAGLVVLSD